MSRKQKLSIMLLLILLFASCCACVTAFAASSSDFDSTNVLDDLKNSIIAGEKFDPDDYPYTSERELKVLIFVEYGYGVRDISHYGLYVYVYNPSGYAIQNVSSNKIAVATKYNTKGEAQDYDKFELQLLSVSEGKYAQLFYKFKLKDPSALLVRVLSNGNKRRYDISEIELRFTGSMDIVAYEVANYWEYSGYAKGLGADAEAESTLNCKTDGIDVLALDVHDTWYRHVNGVDTQTNLSSVYFGVPNDIFEKYGKLQQIKANWFETKTQEMLVLTDEKLAEGLAPYAGYSMQDYSFDMSKIATSSGRSYRAIYGGETTKSATNAYVDLYSFHFDGEYHNNPTWAWSAGLGDKYVNKIWWSFYTPSGRTTSDALLAYAKLYTARMGGNLLIDKYSSELFLPEVDSNRQYGWQGNDGQGVVIDADALFDIKGFDTGSNLLNWWYGLFNDLDIDPLEDIKPIYLVQESDVLFPSTIADNLYISTDDVNEFLDVYRQNEFEGKSTVLFRFAVTNYTAYDLYGEHNAVTKLDNVGYLTQQTMFLDFDIIWLKFVKDNVATIIPVVSNPIDIASGTTPSLDNGIFGLTGSGQRLSDKIMNWLKDYWWVLPVGVVGIVLAIVFFRFVLIYVLKGICWLIRAPFRAIGAAIRRRK